MAFKTAKHLKLKMKELGVEIDDTEFFVFSSPYLSAIESAAAITATLPNIDSINVQD